MQQRGRASVARLLRMLDSHSITVSSLRRRASATVAAVLDSIVFSFAQNRHSAFELARAARSPLYDPNPLTQSLTVTRYHSLSCRELKQKRRRRSSNKRHGVVVGSTKNENWTQYTNTQTDPRLRPLASCDFPLVFYSEFRSIEAGMWPRSGRCLQAY